MRVLSKNDYKLFETLAELTQKNLRKTLSNFLKRKYDTVITTKDYIYAEGTIPIALVAHMDTVFKSPPSEIYYDQTKNVMWSPQGLGADDRAGVFAILKIIQSGLRPSVIFTTDEESGALGAEAMVKAYKDAPQEFKYIIQLDRRGSNDCVFYDCANPKFEQYVESFGFSTAWGSFSDISVLCPAWGIAGVNLSIGYFNEHQEIETLHVSYLLRTISLVKKMLKEEEIPSFEYIPDENLAWWKYGTSIAMGYDKGYSTDHWFLDEEFVCNKCQGTFQDYEVIPVKNSHGEIIKYYCPDCCVTELEWCNYCYEPYEPKFDKNNTKMCPMCRTNLEITGGDESDAN